MSDEVRDRPAAQHEDSSLTQIGAGKNEVLLKEALSSEQWDRSDGTPTRLRYMIFSPQRTGSELLCSHLTQRGIGMPFEYFNHLFMPKIARRLGCLGQDGRIVVARYLSLLEPKRTRNGIFGTKLQPDQLNVLAAGDSERARSILRRFDKIILLRRRDKLLQAISLARARLTNQWQMYRDDPIIRMSTDDRAFFPMIAESLGKILEDERYMASFESELNAQDVRALWYEDLRGSRALDAAASWLWNAAGGGTPKPEYDRGHDLPRKMDESEARGIKERFLAHVGVAG
jgi:LPS sulfotransferase NodH